MTPQLQEVTCPYDHHSPEFADRFREIHNELRATAPLAWSEEYGGFWVATSYELVRRLARDSDNFTVARGPGRVGGIHIPPPPGALDRPRFVPGEADGEEHDHYRLALNPHFSRRKIEDLTPMIERQVTAAVDRIVDQRDFDIAQDLVGPILADITCQHMGLDVADSAGFFQGLHYMVLHGSDGTDDVKDAFDASWAEIVRVAAARREHPRDDVISHLVQWEPAFTDEQIHMMVLNVSLGANNTTKSLVGQALMYIDRHPDLRARLRENPDLVRPAVDEFLRLLPVVGGPARTATSDVEVDGITIREGERVLLVYPSANHDPQKYANPSEFDLDRGAAQHLAMGVGTHFCLGAWLAKSLTEITIRQMLERCPDFFVDHALVEFGPDRGTVSNLLRVPAHVSREG